MSSRVSVVVPFLNGSRYLQEAVESVLEQTYRDWEALLIDGGSIDDGMATARQLADRHPDRIRCLTRANHKGREIGASWNVGIRESTGDFVAPLDADDVWVPDKLEQQVAILDSHPAAAMVYGPSQLWWSWSGRTEDRPRDRVQGLGVPADTIIEPPRLLRGILEHRVRAPRPSSVLLRREAVISVGGFEEPFVDNTHTDQAFYARLFLAAPVYASGRCWARHRQHSVSSAPTKKELGERATAELEFLEWLERYLDGVGIRSVEVRDVVQRQLSECRYRTSSPFGRLMRDPARALKGATKRSIPAGALNTLRRLKGARHSGPPVGAVCFGDFRRLQPISRKWGYDRGLPIDRYYIETFLERHSADVRGRVMEIGDNDYTWRFGREAVTDSDVLNIARGDPKTTLVADLAAGDHLPSNRFDCIIFTETLHLLYDFLAGLRTLHRILKPGGVLLATFPGITKLGREDDWGTTWYWSFTPLSARRIFEETFPGAEIAFEVWGNVLSSTACLWGLAANELRREELEHKDPEYPVTITVRAARADMTLRRQ